MFDLFGRKARVELAAAKARMDDMNLELMHCDDRIRELVDIIRENDQRIFNMSMQSSWDKMRPIFNQMQVGQESRMRNESNRINDILKTELLEVYRK